MLAERLLIGAGFTDHGLVFCRPDGGPHVGDAGAVACRAPKIVNERLGQARIAITLDTYSHVTDGLHRDAANLVAGPIAGKSVSSALANASGGGHQ
jgi:hypothetical protein